jgi:hypothetical protein
MHSPRIFVLVCLTLCLLGACGGGGGSSGGAIATPPATYTIGGTVTGLTGSVTLQNNGGDRLTVASNGTFSFATPVSAGSAYAVTVATQPDVPDCVVNNGTGNATGNISAIAVVCSINPATRFIPMQGDRPGSAICQFICFSFPDGLYVLSTKHIDRAPVHVVNESIQPLAVVPEHTVTANATVTSARPATLIFRKASATEGEHLWALDLSGGSALVPRQLGSLTVRSAAEGAPATYPALCGAELVLKKLDDPTSAVLIVRLSDEPQFPCSGASRNVLVSLSDSPATAPRVVPAVSGILRSLYHPDGTLAGIIGTDPASQDLVYFTNETFTGPRRLFSGPLSVDLIRDGNSASWSSSTWTDLMGTQTSTIIATDDGTSHLLYRIDNDGSAHLLYDFSKAVNSPLRFGANLYLQDQDDPFNPSLISIMRIPVDGSAPGSLLSYPPDPNCYAVDSAAGVVDQKLVVWRTCWVGTQSTASHVLSLPGPALNVATTLATYSGALDNVAVVSDRILVSVIKESPNSNPLSASQYEYSTAVLDKTGSVLMPAAPGAFLNYHADPADTLLQARDVAGPQLTGAFLYKLTIGATTPSVVQLQNADGTPARLPTDASGGNGVAVSPGLVFTTYADGTTANYAAVVDLAANRIVKLNSSGVNMQLIAGVR